MVAIAKSKLRYQAAFQPILFELLPPRFTLRVLQNLYQDVFKKEFDKRNFIRKVLAGGLLIKTNIKEKNRSKKGAFYYKLDKREYRSKFQPFLNYITSPQKE